MKLAIGTISGLTICAAAAIAGPAQSQTANSATTQFRTEVSNDVDAGRLAYNENCAVCHGAQGTGQDRQPYWNYLNKHIPSLADLSAKNGGLFPFARVYQTIDGRHEQMARGPRDMPIWGVKFKAESVGLNAAYDSEAYARAKILALTEYVYSLQRTAGNGDKLACRSGAALLTGFETPAEYYALQNGSHPDGSYACRSRIEFVSEFENPYEETMRAASAGFSSVTGEQTNGDAAYLTAYVERSDGSGHPAFASDEQRLLLYKMPSGKYVLRVIQDPPEKYWPGAH